LIARRVANIAYGFYAASDVAARIAAGTTPTWIGFDEANAALPEARFAAWHFPRARPVAARPAQVSRHAAHRCCR
jgi:hypothetical protein